MSTPYATHAFDYRRAGWHGILPLPNNAKAPVPAGYTGRAGAWPLPADIQTWIDFDPHLGNIALRLPEDVIGLDVDMYNGKQGAATLARLEAELGPLPPTITSTSRTDGSGIRPFRVPYRPTWRDPGPGVEIIHYGWRYMVVWPSIHPDGRTYVWVNQTTGEVLDSQPSPGGLPDLPAAWVDRLSSDEHIGKADVTNEQVKAWLDTLPDGPPCQAATNALDDFTAKLAAAADGGSRHDGVLRPSARIVRVGEMGHHGIREVLSVARQRFLAAVTHDDSRDADEAASEWRRLIAGAVAIVTADPTPADHRRCRCRPELNVTNAAKAAEWLAGQIGAGKLSGLFARGDRIVYTPHEGEDGYRELTAAPNDEDGPAQVQLAQPILVARLVDRAWKCYRTTTTKNGKPKDVPALFPKASADRICATTDGLDNLRSLHGVIHTPVFRPDGTLIDRPGYDPTTRLLYLPEPGLRLLPIPDHPTAQQLASAVAVINDMIAEFPFVTDHDRANYIGMLLTPLLRAIVGPPYKLGAIEAHQRGSGKTLLANIIRHIHGGVFRGEMPEDDAELRKQVSTILDVTTGAVVVIDNVSGTLNSSTLASLLTASRWDDRKLGTMSEMISRPNDRLWIITGNNLVIGGDLPRRTLRCTIDPKMPQPERRTGFKIADLEGWVLEYRGDLLCALLTIVRAWVAAGRPLGPRMTSDGYSTWQRTVAGILTNAGIDGTFDHRETQIIVGSDDEDWAEFLAAVHRGWGTTSWTCKELLDEATRVYIGNGQAPKRLDTDDLPSDFTRTDSYGNTAVAINTRALGKWMSNRRGRWAGDYTIREAGTHAGIKKWCVEAATRKACDA